MTEWWVIVVVERGKPRTLAFEERQHAARWRCRREDADRPVMKTRTTTPPMVAEDGLREFPQPQRRGYVPTGSGAMHRHRAPKGASHG